MPSEQPPFIPTQRLWRLVCPVHLQEKCLHPKTAWSLPRDESRERKRPILSDGIGRELGHWEWVNPGARVQDDFDPVAAARERCEWLSRVDIRRLCVTVDAGQGKSKALEQAQYLRQTGENRDCLAILVQFDELPTSRNMFLGVDADHADDPDKTPLLIGKLQRDHDGLRGRDAWRLLKRLIRQGRFTLLVDSLDQATHSKDADGSCRALKAFLQSSPEVRCVVSGRPYAVQWYWDDLFKASNEQEAWEFAMVDPFTPVESRRFLGEKRFNLLNQIEADVIAIPRALEAILEIEDGELEQIRTKADVYLKSLESLLNKGVKPVSGGLPEDQAWMLFSLLGFEMLRQGYRAGSAGVPPGKRKDEFLKEVWRSQSTQLKSQPLLIMNEIELNLRLVTLLSVNENLVNPVLAWRGDKGQVVHFYWRNQTLMDMFGALWITRYAEQDHEYDWFHEQLGKEESREVCQLATEMALNDSLEKYAQAMRVIYEDGVAGTRNAQDRPRRRWTEWIYRSWPNLLQAAGYLTGGQMGRSGFVPGDDSGTGRGVAAC
jgi:hypothetical protein